MKPHLSAFWLKLIAMITMVIDHWGIRYANNARIFRLFGRISFPIYAWFIAESVFHTRSPRRTLFHALRLLLLGLLAEVPYDLFFSNTLWNPSRNNVIFTLLIGYLVCSAMENMKEKILSPLVILAGCWAADHFSFSYHWIGILMISAFYLLQSFHRRHPDRTGVFRFGLLFVLLLYALYYVFHNASSPAMVWSQFLTWNYVQAGALLCGPLLLLYDGKRGCSHPAWLWLYRLFYPLHLSLLLLLEHFGLI